MFTRFHWIEINPWPETIFTCNKLQCDLRVEKFNGKMQTFVNQSRECQKSCFERSKVLLFVLSVFSVLLNWLWKLFFMQATWDRILFMLKTPSAWLSLDCCNVRLCCNLSCFYLSVLESKILILRINERLDFYINIPMLRSFWAKGKYLRFHRCQTWYLHKFFKDLGF